MLKVFKRVLVVVVAFACLFSVGGCKKTPTGVYVHHILFEFDNYDSYELASLLNEGMTDGEKHEILLSFAKAMTTTDLENNVRPVLGSESENSIISEIEGKLRGVSGQAAIDFFKEYIAIYNCDPGMVDNDLGYLIPLAGETIYIASFADLSRQLFNPSDPTDSIGNAFVDGELAYCLTNYGVHIIMITSLSY